MTTLNVPMIPPAPYQPGDRIVVTRTMPAGRAGRPNVRKAAIVETIEPYLTAARWYYRLRFAYPDGAARSSMVTTVDEAGTCLEPYVTVTRVDDARAQLARYLAAGPEHRLAALLCATAHPDEQVTVTGYMPPAGPALASCREHKDQAQLIAGAVADLVLEVATQPRCQVCGGRGVNADIWQHAGPPADAHEFEPQETR